MPRSPLRRNVGDLPSGRAAPAGAASTSPISISRPTLFGRRQGLCRWRSARSASPACTRGAARRRRRARRRRQDVPFCLSTFRLCAHRGGRRRRASGRSGSSSTSSGIAASCANARFGARGRLRRARLHRRSADARRALPRRPFRHVAAQARACRQIAAGDGPSALGLGRRPARPAAQPRQFRAVARQGTGNRPIISAGSARNFDPSITWRDIEWIRAHWDGPLIDQGHARSRGCARGGPRRRRRHRRLQSWRPPARRRAFDRPRASRHRRCGRRRAARCSPTAASARGSTSCGCLRSAPTGVLLGRAWAYALAAQGGAGVDRLLGLLATRCAWRWR